MPKNDRYDSKTLTVVMLSFAFALLNLFSLIQQNQATEQFLIPPQQGDALLIDENRLTVIANPDGLQWVMHTQKATEEGLWRLPRWVETDNHPYGRSLLWPSLHSYWLRFLGWIIGACTGLPVGVAIAKGAVYSNTAYLLLFSIPISFLASRQFGYKGILLIPAFILLLSYPKYGLRYPDHHLLHVCLTLLYLQTLTLDDKAINLRTRFITSGTLLGLLFWTSALSAVVITAATTVAYPFLRSSRGNPIELRKLFWFTGSAAVIACLAYLWDYFPNYEIHLECVHPIYAICVLLSTFILNQWNSLVRSNYSLKRLNYRLIVYSVLGFAAIGLLILMNLTAWYTPSNLFLSRWMELISESRPLNIARFLSPNIFTALVLLLTSGSLLMCEKANYNNQTIVFQSVFLAIIFAFCLSQNRVTDFVWPSLSLLIITACSLNRKNIIGLLLTCILIIMWADRFQERKTNSGVLQKFGDTAGLDNYVTTSYNWQLESQKILEKTSANPGSILAMPDIGMYLNYYTQYPIFGSYYWENYDGMLRNMHMVFRRKDPENGDFPDIIEFLQAAKVDYLCVSTSPLDLRFSYTIYGSENRIRDPLNCFFGHIKEVDEANIPEGLNLIMETEKTRLFRVVTTNPNTSI